MSVRIDSATSADADLIAAFVKEHWRADFIVTRGRKIFPKTLPALIARESKECVGLLSYEVIGKDCEIIAFEALKKHQGIGSALLDEMTGEAKKLGCRRLWLITTNDNLEALRFYQRRGFRLRAVHPDAISLSRKLKPTIPVAGNFGIPICDELELEMTLS